MPTPDAQVESEEAEAMKPTVRSIIVLALYLIRKGLQKLVCICMFLCLCVDVRSVCMRTCVMHEQLLGLHICSLMWCFGSVQLYRGGHGVQTLTNLQDYSTFMIISPPLPTHFFATSVVEITL